MDEETADDRCADHRRRNGRMLCGDPAGRARGNPGADRRESEYHKKRLSCRRSQRAERVHFRRAYAGRLCGLREGRCRRDRAGGPAPFDCPPFQRRDGGSGAPGSGDPEGRRRPVRDEGLAERQDQRGEHQADSGEGRGSGEDGHGSQSCQHHGSADRRQGPAPSVFRSGSACSTRSVRRQF